MADVPAIVVVGGANIDIGGRSDNPLLPRDSSPGKVSFSPGGVGRNIAHNIALLGAPVHLISAFGGDAFGELLAESCRAAGVDLSATPTLNDAGTAAYLYITGPDGEMELAVNDMAICKRLDTAFLAERLELLQSAALCVADTNLPAESLAWLAEHCPAPLMVDPVSTAKAGKIKPLLGRLHTLKCNLQEALYLSAPPQAAAPPNTIPHRAAEALLAAGVRRVVITLGAAGVLCADADGHRMLPPCEGPVENVTGAGDAFTAAMAAAFIKNLPLAKATAQGLAAAALCVAAPTTISPLMSAARVAQVAAAGHL